MAIGYGPVQLLYNKLAVIVVSVYISLPYAILPLYSSIEKLDFGLIDAARDLGANKYQALLKVFYLNKKWYYDSNNINICTSNSSYAVPDIVGGEWWYDARNVTANKMLVLRDWPSASICTVFIVIILIVVSQVKGGRKDADDKRRILLIPFS